MPVVLRDDVFPPTRQDVSLPSHPLPWLVLFRFSGANRGEIAAGGGQLTCVADTKLVCDPTQQDRGRELCKATS